MVKHTQTIRRLLPTNCLSVFDHFVGLVLKGLSYPFKQSSRREMLETSITLVKLNGIDLIKGMY